MNLSLPICIPRIAGSDISGKTGILISLNEHASHLKIGAFEDGVLAEFVLDGYHGVLQGCLLTFLTLGSFPLHSCDIEKNVVNYRDEVSVHVTVTIGISSYRGEPPYRIWWMMPMQNSITGSGTGRIKWSVNCLRMLRCKIRKVLPMPVF